MICKYCGNQIPDGLNVCPCCGSVLDENAQIPYEQDYDDYEETEEGAEDEAFPEERKPRFSLPKMNKLPGVPKLSPSTILAASAAFFSFLALVMVCMLNSNIKDRVNALDASVQQVKMSLSEVQTKLSTLDSTVANVQQEAYTQLANTTITITKDITSLTGPVTPGKFNQMFIIKVKGNLDLAKSFAWQKFNVSANKWEDIVFTGSATSNEEMGLRLENLMEGNEFKSVLWANGITKAAEGNYRCVITDVNGIKKTSLEAAVSVADA